MIVASPVGAMTDGERNTALTAEWVMAHRYQGAEYGMTAAVTKRGETLCWETMVAEEVVPEGNDRERRGGG
jgi:hypothetical protein